jgi:UPF0755 protein
MTERRTPGDASTVRTSTAAPRSAAELLEPRRSARATRRRSVKVPRDREPREPRRTPKVVRVLSAVMSIALAGVILLGGVAFYLNSAMDAPGPLQAAKIAVIPKNDGPQDIAQRLEREGHVADWRLFIASYRWQQVLSIAIGAKAPLLKAGDYEIKPRTSIRGIIDVLNDGRTVLAPITIPEGLTSHQIVERLKANTALTGDVATVPAEGTLLPDTYSVPRGATRQAVIELMQEAQKKLIEKVWPERQDGLPIKTPQEALTLASIVEKETGSKDERERVAAVFINRLRQNMRLQSDPTILYGIFGGRVSWGRPIYKNEIAAKNMHNTYQIDGLPQTPICNPGKAAIEATLKPASTKDLYFVADGKGGHIFAETLKDHNANVAKWREIEKGLQAKGLLQGATAAGAAAAATPAGDQTAPATTQGTSTPPTRAVVRSAPSAEAAAAARAAPPPAPTVLNAPGATPPAAQKAKPPAPAASQSPPPAKN